MDLNELERFQNLEQENVELKERVQELEDRLGSYPEFKFLCDNIQKWLEEDYFENTVKEWIFEKYSPEVQKWICENFAEELQNWIDDYVTRRLNGEPSFAEQRESEQEHD